MPVLAWIALAVFIVASAGGTAFAAVRALTAWRELRRFQRRLGRGLMEVTHGLVGAEARLTHATESAARLDRARAHLQHSLATLAVMRASAGDAGGALRLLGFLRR